MDILIKIALALLIITILVNLFRAMFSMLNPDPNKPSMSHFIGKRLKFSVVLILILLLCLAFGWIQPNPRPY